MPASNIFIIIHACINRAVCHALGVVVTYRWKKSRETIPWKTSNSWWQPSRIWIFSRPKPAKEHYYFKLFILFPTMPSCICYQFGMGYDCRTINGMKYKFVYLYLAKLSPRRGLPYMYTESRCKGERSAPVRWLCSANKLGVGIGPKPPDICKCTSMHKMGWSSAPVLVQ